MYVFAGTAVHGPAEPAVYNHQHVTNQPTPAAFADRGPGPGLHSSGDASQSPVQGTLQLTVSQTANDAFVPDSESSAPVSDAPATLTGASAAAAEHSDRPLANMKEKTPMCLINELARFNKVCSLSLSFLVGGGTVTASILSRKLHRNLGSLW